MFCLISTCTRRAFTVGGVGDHLWLFSRLVSIIAINETGRAIASKIRYSSIIELAIPLIYIKVDKINTV